MFFGFTGIVFGLFMMVARFFGFRVFDFRVRCILAGGFRLVDFGFILGLLASFSCLGLTLVSGFLVYQFCFDFLDLLCLY